MSLNYKNVAIKPSTNDDGLVEVKKGKKQNSINIVSTISSYDKDYLNEIINDTFELEHSGTITEAQIDFEDMVENEFYLKIKNTTNHKSKSLHDIIKYHSAHYYNIKQDIHKNKSKYL